MFYAIEEFKYWGLAIIRIVEMVINCPERGLILFGFTPRSAILRVPIGVIWSENTSPA